MEGRVCLHRKILEWEWWDDHNVFRLFCFILLSCNHKSNKRKGQLIEKGSFITSYEKLSIGTGLSYQKIRTCLQKLESTSEITRQVTSKNQTITVCNWEIYQQEEKKVTNKSTGKQQTNNKQITTNNNDNNENKIVITGTSNQEIDESIKKQIKEIIPIEVLTNNREKFFTLVELIALGLSTIATEKAIYSRINDLEKKLDVNGVYSLDMMGQKIYDRKKAWNVAQTCRSWNEAQKKPCGNPLNSFNTFLSNKK